MLAINDIILTKIDSLRIPNKMKDILKETLKAEEQMRLLNDKKNYKTNLGKILQKYADDDDVREFCSNYDY